MADTDRADRLNRRREDNAAEKPERQSSESQSESDGSIKDQYEGIYMFLPEDLHEEFNIVANEVDSARRRQSGNRVEKIRHFEPLVVALGLEAIENLDDDELEKRLAEFDP